ncbi:MAG: hypothetical protein NTX85_02765 [Candidatus Nomurabacteria bacterium]|nr:hypothetical protein [Candidatus Nomurabacteria bacterium]
MTIIYGVDTDKKVNPEDVRDAIIECFTLAHNEVLEDLKNYAKNMDDISFQEIKHLSVVQMIRNYFNEVGGDFDKPDKESILLIMEKLKEFAKNFRDQSIAEKHFQEIMLLVCKL